MATHTSATLRKHTPHLTEQKPTTRTATILDVLKRRAQAVLNDESIDAQSRAIIRYGLETNDPSLADLVKRADAGENLADTFDFSQTPERGESPSGRENASTEEKIAVLAEIICRDGDESAGALLVLMGTLEDSSHPKVLAKTAKQIALTRCGELNFFGVVDAQIELLENELLGA